MRFSLTLTVLQAQPDILHLTQSDPVYLEVA